MLSKKPRNASTSSGAFLMGYSTSESRVDKSPPSSALLTVDNVVSLMEVRTALREAEAQLRLLRTAFDKIPDSESFGIGGSLPS